MRHGTQQFAPVLALMGMLTFVGADGAHAADTPASIGLRNPTFVRQNPDPKAAPAEWELGQDTQARETAYLAGTYALTTSSDDMMARQRLDFGDVAGKRLEAVLEARGEGGAQVGLAVLIETAEGRQTALRPIWDQPLTAAYARVAGALTLPADARRIVGIELHRSNRRGTVQCREVSLYEASSWQEIKDGTALYDRYCHPLGEPFVSGDGVRWGQPLHGGPVGLLIILDIRYARLAVELAERLDLRADTILRNSYTGDWFAWEGAGRINARLSGKDRPYDVILAADPVTSEPLAQAIERAVAAGGGLVVTRDATDPASQKLLAGMLPETRPLADRPELARQVPWQYFPLYRKGGGALASVGAGTHGQGRVVSIEYGGPLRGFMPDGLRLAEDSSGLARWWESVYSLLGKSIVWSANRRAPATIAEVRLDAERGAAEATVTAGAPFAGSLSLSWAEQDPVLGPAEAKLPVAVGSGGKITIAFRIPETLRRCNGLHIVNAFLRDAQGRTVDWASTPLAVSGSITLARQHPLGRDWFTAGQAMAGAVSVANAGGAPADLTVTSTLTDVYGRRTWADTRALRVAGGGSAPSPVVPSVSRALTAYHRLRIAVSDPRGVLDAREWTVVLPDQFKRALEDFQFGAAANYYVGLHTDDPLAAYLRSVGVTFSSEGGPFEIAPRLDMPWHFMTLGGSLMHNPNPESHERRNCFSNPDVVGEIVRNATAVYPLVRRNGAVFHTLADEAELVKDGVVETCFCPLCAAGFRAWAQKAYGTLEAANAEWGTAYQSWDGVGPTTADEARQRGNFAQWADFRACMEDSLIALLQAVQAGVKAQAPEALVGYANPFGLNPFSGADNAKMARAEAVFAKYMRPDVAREYLTLNPDAPAHTYHGYGGDPLWCKWVPWWFAMSGGDFLAWWDPYGGGHPILGLFDCFGRQTERSVATLESVPDLTTGAGKILHDFPLAGQRAAILYSQTSMHTAWAESGMKMGEAPWGDRAMYLWAETPPLHSYKLFYRSTENAKALVKEMLLQPQFVTAEDIAAGKLNSVRLLVLPYAGALSEETLARITEFVQKGGTVLADLRTAAYSGHGKPLPSRPSFEQLFGVRRTAAGFSPDASPITGAGALAAVPSGEGFDQPTGREPLELLSGQALARHADGAPAVIVNAVGKGKAVYLNFVPGSGPGTIALVRQVMQQAGIEGEIRLTKGQDPVLGYECYQYARGPVRYVGVLRDMLPQAPDDRMSWHGHQFRHATLGTEAIALRLPQACEVYDVRAGKYLGRVATVPLKMAATEARLLGLLPYRVTGLSVSGVQVRYGPGSVIRYRAAVATDRGPCGDHVLRIEVFNPAGKPVRHYTRNVLAVGGKYEGVVPLALNDTVGPWSMRVTDVTTKATQAATFTVVAGTPAG